MATKLYVISDLHLGGAEGFQMCTPDGRKRLAKFIDWVTTQPKADGDEKRLVINGDIVDFLAEEKEGGGYAAFTQDQDQAVETFARIAKSCKDIFAALKRFLAEDGHLVLMLGNHDIELSFPKLRRELHRQLGPGSIELVSDNEAYSVGRVLIEHGNRYDPWNMVNHGRLRALCSAMSRGETSAAFPAQPGSELVANVMNPIKQTFGFVDLLKPETGAVVPILPLLDAAKWNEVRQALRRKIESWQRDRFTAEGVPAETDYVAGDDEQDAAEPVELPQELKDPLDEADRAAREILDKGGDEVGWIQDLPARLILKKFRLRRETLESSFKVEEEEPEYLKAAKTLAGRGFDVILFGHTHLAKRKVFPGYVYLNTGTWADLMRLPAGIYGPDEDAAFKLFQVFLDDVKHNRIANYRRQVATFASVTIDAKGAPSGADVHFFDADGSVSPVSTEGLATRLA